MVKYFDINNAINAYSSGQRSRKVANDSKSFRTFAQSLRDGDYTGAAASIGETGDVSGALRTRDIPFADEASRLGNQFTQTRIDDVGTDNRRADQVFQANQQQRQYSNARAEAEARISQAQAKSALGKLKQDFDAGLMTPEQYQAGAASLTAQSGGNLTSTQRDYEFARQQGFPGSFLDYQEQSKSAGRQKLTAGDRRSILEADESVNAGQNVIRTLDAALELNDDALSGYGAKARAYAGSLFGHDSSEAAMQLDNLVTANALESLKATFGGMPTEGERKILIEVQGSINQPPAVRKEIFTRAKAAAQRRIEFNKNQAEGIRTGEIYQPGYSQNRPNPQPGAIQSPPYGGNVQTQQQAPQQGPQPGMVEDGFQFIGGDPADPNNWRQVP